MELQLTNPPLEQRLPQQISSDHRASAVTRQVIESASNMRYAILLAILTLSPLSGLPSCASSPSQEQPKDQPKDAIERLYRAVAAQECDAVMAEFTRAYRDTLTGAALPCSELIEKVGAYPLQEVLKTAVDGRQAGARLVRVRLQGRTADVIFRVEVEAGQWKIASM